MGKNPFAKKYKHLLQSSKLCCFISSCSCRRIRDDVKVILYFCLVLTFSSTELRGGKKSAFNPRKSSAGKRSDLALSHVFPPETILKRDAGVTQEMSANIYNAAVINIHSCTLSLHSW